MEIGNPHPTNQTHRRQPLPNKKNPKAAEEVPSLQGAARFFAPTSALNFSPNSKSRASSQRVQKSRGQSAKKSTLSEQRFLWFSSAKAAPPPPRPSSQIYLLTLSLPSHSTRPAPAPPRPPPNLAGSDDERRRAAEVHLGAAPIRHPRQCRRRPVVAAGTAAGSPRSAWGAGFPVAWGRAHWGGFLCACSVAGCGAATGRSSCRWSRLRPRGCGEGTARLGTRRGRGSSSA
jgi:hypothetical protein